MTSSASGVNGVNLESRVHAPGETAKAWFRSKVDPTLWCKGDTSSDELDGHYFAWYLYHVLVADDAEKKEIAAVVRRVTDHIIGNGFTLVDHTGRKTRWGIWAPELINHTRFTSSLRPLNSLEILAFLKVAAHITGDVRYARAFDELVQKHHYLLNSLMMRRYATGQWPDINHSDDELLYLVYYPLLRLEKDPSRRRILTQSIARTWEEGEPGEQPIRREHSPLYNFVYGATTGRHCDVEAATETLEDWPWDLLDWATRGSHRTDVQVLTSPGRHRNRTQLNRVLPVSERSQGRWNSSPWIADGGGSGRLENDGVAWSLAYWLGVYHGFLPKVGWAPPTDGRHKGGRGNTVREQLSIIHCSFAGGARALAFVLCRDYRARPPSGDRQANSWRAAVVQEKDAGSRQQAFVGSARRQSQWPSRVALWGRFP